MYGKKINSSRPLLDMTTCDTTTRVTTLFHCVLFSNIRPRRRLQRPMLNANATEVLVDKYLQHPLPWREMELPAGLSPSTQGTENPEVAEEDYSVLHLHLSLAFCKSGSKPNGLQMWPKLQEMACK